MIGIFLCREEGKVLEHIIHLKIEGMKVKPSVQLLKGLSHEMDLPLITCMVSSWTK
jgi:hypothetical protein